jgi:AraC-like DNA-binding protein
MDDTHLYLGWRTAGLGLASVQILCLACAIGLTPTQRRANRLLAASLVALVGVLTPYAIGYAGAYDAWRWLTFAPFSIPLALGPLLYAYARSLEGSERLGRLAGHLAPAIVQAGYFTVCFLLPLDAKWAWYTGGHERWVGPIWNVLTPASLAYYSWAIGRVLRRYRSRLADQRSDDDRFSAPWLSRVRAAILIGLLVEAGFWLWSVSTGGIDYFQETGLYLSLAALGLYLAVSGWRHAALPAPLVSRMVPPSASNGDVGAASPDWSAVASDFAARTRAEAWWKDADLTLPLLARRLGTNSGRLSRAINIGLGVNFSTFVNGQRAEAVAAALQTRPGADLLDLAFEMGFASKASFNRAFRARYGVAPSQYRRQVSDPAFFSEDPILRRV